MLPIGSLNLLATNLDASQARIAHVATHGRKSPMCLVMAGVGVEFATDRASVGSAPYSLLSCALTPDVPSRDAESQGPVSV